MSRSPQGLSGEPLRLVRAVEILERIGTLEAIRLLERLAQESTETWATTDARLALVRLKASLTDD